MLESKNDDIANEVGLREKEKPKSKDVGSEHPRRQSSDFKQELLSRLPVLEAPKWEASETLNIYQGLQAIIDLDADSFLEPLEPIAERKND